MSEYETIGSIGNSFIIPHDIECSKAIFTASKVMDLFGNAATGVNTTSSRHLKNIKLHYNNDYKKIIGATIELSLIDSLRISASLTPKQINQDYNLNPSLIGLIIGDLYLDKSQLADEFQQFKDELIELGMSNEILDEIITCLIGFLSFFNIDIEGDDSVILSEKSVNSIRNIEKIFHLESQSLEKYLLYRIDDKLGGGKGTVTFDNRPIDAKAILNAFCSDIYQKIIKYLLDFCSEKSLNGIFIDTTEYDTDTPDSQRSNTLNLIDITGYELLNQYDNTLNNGFSQFAINYVQEKLSTYYITSSINKYIKSYADDKIALQLPPSLSNLTQDSNLYSDLFDRPSLGMVNQLEDVCNAVRGDDRVFTDKVLTVHSRSKLVRSAGHKSITNSFIVKHSFNDSVPYDTTGFIAYNKARVNIQGQQLLAMMPFHILRTSIDGSNTIVESDPRESPIIYDAASRRSAISDATSMRSSIATGKEHTVIVDDCANIYSFGKNDYGQLGHNNRIPLNDPKLLETIDLSLQIPLKDLANTVVDVCCGQGHTLLLTKSGRIYSWGDNRRGQLGHSHFESCAIPRLVGHDPSNTPASTAVQIKGTLVMPNRGTGSSSGTRAKDLIIKNVKQIGCGLFHSACIVDPGYLYTWGAGELLGRILNENGVEIVSTANNKSTKNLKSKVNFPDSCDPINPVFFVKHRVHYLSCGNQHTISRCNTEFYSWGNNSYGQLGLGDTYNCLLPSKVKLPTIKEAEAATSQLVSGGNHMALIVKGKLYTWGCNTSGQIGNNSKEHVSTPTLITIPNISDKGVSFKQVVCGYGYTSVILSNNQLFHWGNMYIPSDNSTVDKVIPKPFSVPEKDFGNTIALASISSTTLSILAIDSEDIVEMKPKTLTIVNSEKPTINPLTSQTIQSISLRKSVNQPTSKLHNQPFYTTKSTKDIERQIYRDNFNSIEITNNLRSTLGIGFRISKIVNKSEKSTSPSTSPGTKKTSIKGKTISCTSIKDSIKDKIGKVKRDAILDYFVTNQSSNKQSNKNNESNLNDFKMSDSDLIISSPIVQLSNKRGVNIPKTEKDILEKFASQRQQSHVKHLNQLVVGSIDDIPISDYDIRASRRISSSPSRFSVYKVNRNTSPDMNSQADKEEKVEIVDESMRSLSSSFSSNIFLSVPFFTLESK
eukprot:gene17265-22797_t